jgi:hypothetical protein
LVAACGAPGSSDDLASKARRSLRAIAGRLTELAPLTALVVGPGAAAAALPDSVLAAVLGQVIVCLFLEWEKG